VTAPVAAIVIVAMLIVGLGWLALVLTKTLPIDSGLSLLTHLGVFLFGANVPLVQWFRSKRIRLDTSSDPPSGGEKQDDPEP
jgi:hypothetical protein